MAKGIKITKQGLAAFITIIILGAATGIFIGIWLTQNLLGGQITNYDGYDPITYRQQNGSLSTSYYQQFLKPSDSQLNKENIQQLFLAAEKNGNTANKYMITANGLIDTIAKQQVRTYKKYDALGEDYKFYSENFSSGAKDVVELTHYSNPNQITVTLGKFASGGKLENYLSGTLGNYTGSTTKIYTQAEHLARYGLPAAGMTPYIVSTATLVDKDADKKTFKKTTLPDGRTAYNFKLTLDRVYSVIEYVQQMSIVSGLDDKPTFTSDIVLDVTLVVLDDGRVMFQQIKTNEHYTMKFGALYPRCHGTLTQTFDFESDVDMPKR